jgi:hypothetical protein
LFFEAIAARRICIWRLPVVTSDLFKKRKFMKRRLMIALFEIGVCLLFSITSHAVDSSQYERWTGGELNVKSETFKLGVYNGKTYILPKGTYDNVILVYQYYVGQTAYHPHIDIFVPAIGQTLYWWANIVDLGQASFPLSGYAVPPGDSVLNGQVNRVEGAKEIRPYSPDCGMKKVSRYFACRYTPSQCLHYETQVTYRSQGVVKCCQEEVREVDGVRTGGFIEGVNVTTNVNLQLTTPNGGEAELNLTGNYFKQLDKNPGTCSWDWPLQN